MHSPPMRTCRHRDNKHNSHFLTYIPQELRIKDQMRAVLAHTSVRSDLVTNNPGLQIIFLSRIAIASPNVQNGQTYSRFQSMRDFSACASGAVAGSLR